jgi:hypothetical protein
MKSQRLLIALTAANLGLLLFQFAPVRPAEAKNVAPVLRGRALEIVDEQGRVRASITVQPPVTLDSRTYPETVLLRLIDPAGSPGIKLGISNYGSALRLGDGAGTGIDIHAKPAGSFVKITNKQGQERLIEP